MRLNYQMRHFLCYKDRIETHKTFPKAYKLSLLLLLPKPSYKIYYKMNKILEKTWKSENKFIGGCEKGCFYFKM